MKVSELMTTDVVTLAPETTLKEGAALLVERGISGVPVVEAERVIGVISQRDILFKERPSVGTHHRVLGWLLDDVGATIKIEARTVGEAMTSPAITIASGRQVADAARVMLSMDISRLPVVDNGRLVGILTETDLVRAFARTDGAIRHEIVDDMLVKTFATPGTALDVRVRDGEVRISGTVATQDQARLVEALVDKVPGVVAADVRLRERAVA